MKNRHRFNCSIDPNGVSRRIAWPMLAVALFWDSYAGAGTSVFFDPAQTAAVVTTNMDSTTIGCDGYLFTYSLDNWWYPTISIGPGAPTGRFSTVNWPNGIQAQTITAGPAGLLTSQSAASITLRRVDGTPFNLSTFTGKILGNTAGAGASFELMPQLNGQDAFPNPLTFDATGYAGENFSYSPALAGYDTYILNLWMDFALTQLTLVDASSIATGPLQISITPSNFVLLSWHTNSTRLSLLQNSDLTSTNWVAATETVNVLGTSNVVAISGTNTARFFRLKQL